MDTAAGFAVEVLTYRQFAHQRGFDIDISHDRLRFPHGVSKVQERRNREAAKHHLGEALRAMEAYRAALEEGSVRAPTDAEHLSARILSHPDHESTKATWRLLVKRAIRRDPSLSEADAVRSIITERMDGAEPWGEALGNSADMSIETLVFTRCRWMGTRTA